MRRASISHSRARESAAEAAIEALGFLGAEPERLERFLALSGLGPQNLRRAAADPAFLGAVLDYIVGDEKLLVEFARASGRQPEDVTRAQAALADRAADES